MALARERLSFPRRAYRAVLDSDGNFRHLFSLGGSPGSPAQAELSWFSYVLNMKDLKSLQSPEMLKQRPRCGRPTELLC